MQDKREVIPPPTSEEWDRLPWPVKAWIVFIVFKTTWQSNLALWWPKMAGVDGAKHA
jgi:hypothetical protein